MKVTANIRKRLRLLVTSRYGVKPEEVRVQMGRNYETEGPVANVLLWSSEGVFRTTPLGWLRTVERKADGLIALSLFMHYPNRRSGTHCFAVFDPVADVIELVDNSDLHDVWQDVAAASEDLRARNRRLASVFAVCPLRSDTPLGIIADWLADNDRPDLEQLVRNEIAKQ